MKAFLAITVLVLCFVAISLADTDAFVKHAITENKVMVFSKSYCPYAINQLVLLLVYRFVALLLYTFILIILYNFITY